MNIPNDTLTLLARQTADAYKWADKLLQSIPYEKWEEIPAGLETNVSWQTGHLIMSYYYHSVMVIVGHQMEIISRFPVRDYADWFTSAAPELSLGKTSAVDLHQQVQMVAKKSLDIIRSLGPEDLAAPLEPTDVPHPIARTKYEALAWNIKHTMWHCGQLGMLKRVVDKRFDFGLRR